MDGFSAPGAELHSDRLENENDVWSIVDKVTYGDDKHPVDDKDGNPSAAMHAAKSHNNGTRSTIVHSVAVSQ